MENCAAATTLTPLEDDPYTLAGGGRLAGLARLGAIAIAYYDMVIQVVLDDVVEVCCNVQLKIR